MSRFNNKPTPEYLRVVTALKGLSLTERGQAYAEACDDDLKVAFATQLGSRAKGRKSWVRLLGRKPDPDADERLPADDHTELWDSSESLTYVSHPYDVKLADMRAIVASCDEHGLDCAIDAHSWYYPGGTVRVTWKRPN